MKTKFLLILSMCILTINCFAQNFYVKKRDYSTGHGIGSLLELNKKTFNVIDSYDFTSDAYDMESLTFDATTNEIYGISYSVIIKYNVITKTESSFTLPEINQGDYGDIIIANGRLFVTKRDYSNSANYIHSLLELNKSTGAVIDTYNFTTPFPNSYSPESLTYDASTNDIYGISDNIVVKYSITTKAESSFTLPEINQGDYGDIIIANGRLFVAKRDYSNPANYIHSLLELNKSTGVVIDTYNFTTLFPNSYSPESLTYDASTNDIYGISDNIVVKYNITTKTESSFTLPEINKGDYGDIIVIAENQTSINNVVSTDAVNVIGYYNVFGEKLSKEPENGFYIIMYDNGKTVKMIK